MERKIIHVDMDAFFASVEQRDQPELRGKPVAVGGNSGRGVIAAASYEARKYGVRSAMPSKLAIKKCPHLVFVKHRFSVYKEVSFQIREIFLKYTDLVEPLSLDEAYLDVTENKFGFKSAIYMASEIRKEIYEVTGLTASAGVSVNKFIAKVASDINKPNGLTVILPEEVEGFIDKLPIAKFYGVGKATQEKMARLKIETGADLKKLDRLELAQHFGKFGRYLYDVVRGKDDRQVKPDRIRKSYSMERTYEDDLHGIESVFDKLDVISGALSESLKKRALKGKTITLKLRYEDFTTYTRSKTISMFFNDYVSIFKLAKELAEPLIIGEKGIRLLGIGLSNLNNQDNEGQLQLEF